MTVSSPPPAPVVPAPRRRWGLLVAVAIVVGVIAWIALSGLGTALVYYQTPTELLGRGQEAIGQYIRLGGVVQAGSLTCPDGSWVDFVMTDGTTEIPVRSPANGEAVICPREGVGVVVQGRLNGVGVFEPDQIIVKHDENYVAPSEGALPSQVIDPGS